MKSIVSKTNPIKLLLILFLVSFNGFTQNQLSVPFTAGFIGAKGTNTQKANDIKTFATLGIAKAFFMQNSTSTTFQTQGNDVVGTLRLQLNSGQLIDIPGAVVWKDTSSPIDYLGFIPSSGFSSVSFSYGAGLTFTIYGTTTTSNIGLGLIGKDTSDFIDGADITGNASGFAEDLNTYLSVTNLPANKPSGPVTVTALTTTNTSPTITGTVTLGAGENLSIEANNILYTTANGLSIVGSSWSLPITGVLANGTYSIVAKITNSSGYTLNDTTSNELVITGTPIVVTSSGSVSANSITVYGNVTSENGSSVTERGFVYATSQNPTIADAKVVSGSGTGTFSQSVSSLPLSTTYYVRAYAINAGGTSYGSELSLTTEGTCGGNIIGSGFGTDPSSASARDVNWKVVALPDGYSPSEPLPYNAYVPKTSDVYNLNIYRTGYTVSGATSYWIAPRSDAKQLLGVTNYNWIVQQTFTVAQSGFYDLNFSGAGDNAISFYINGVIDTTVPLKPTITGGTQIGAKHDSFTQIGTFSGVTYLNAGVNTASMVMEDSGGDTVSLISGSTFTCNNSYVNNNPTIATVSNVTIVEGTSPSPIAFTVSDLETPLNNLTVTASSSNTALIPNDHIVIQGNTGSRTITVSPVSGESGSSTITITLDDNAGGVVTKTFEVSMDSLVLNKYGQFVSDATEAVDANGGKGTGKGQNKFGKKINKPLRN